MVGGLVVMVMVFDLALGTLETHWNNTNVSMQSLTPNTHLWFSLTYMQVWLCLKIRTVCCAALYQRWRN